MVQLKIVNIPLTGTAAQALNIKLQVETDFEMDGNVENIQLRLEGKEHLPGSNTTNCFLRNFVTIYSKNNATAEHALPQGNGECVVEMWLPADAPSSHEIKVGGLCTFAHTIAYHFILVATDRTGIPLAEVTSSPLTVRRLAPAHQITNAPPVIVNLKEGKDTTPQNPGGDDINCCYLCELCCGDSGPKVIDINMFSNHGLICLNRSNQLQIAVKVAHPDCTGVAAHLLCYGVQRAAGTKFVPPYHEIKGGQTSRLNLFNHGRSLVKKFFENTPGNWGQPLQSTAAGNNNNKNERSFATTLTIPASPGLPSSFSVTANKFEYYIMFTLFFGHSGKVFTMMPINVVDFVDESNEVPMAKTTGKEWTSLNANEAVDVTAQNTRCYEVDQGWMEELNAQKSNPNFVPYAAYFNVADSAPQAPPRFMD